MNWRYAGNNSEELSSRSARDATAEPGPRQATYRLQSVACSLATALLLEEEPGIMLREMPGPPL